MNKCSEFVLDDMMAIIVIPVSDFKPGFSAWQLTPTIDRSSFGPDLRNAVTIGRHAASAGGALIPIRPFTGKAKDDESDSVAGRLHKVSVTCEVDDRDFAVWSILLAVERMQGHLLLTFRDGTRGFVQATDDTYVCTVERTGAKTTVQFRIENMMGIQLLV